MIIYRKMKIEGENHPCNGLWYARPVITETLDIVALSKHMAKHNTPFSPGVIKGVLADMVACIKELILDGKWTTSPSSPWASSATMARRVRKRSR